MPPIGLCLAVLRCGSNRFDNVGPAQQLAHQASTRMGNEVQLGARRQQASYEIGEFRSILDWALRERGMLEGQNPVTVRLPENFQFLRSGCGPKSTEAAPGAGSGSMEKDQEGLVCGLLDGLQRCESELGGAHRAAIESQPRAFRRSAAIDDLTDLDSGFLFEVDTQDLKRFHGPLNRSAALHAARQHIEALWHRLDFLGCSSARRHTGELLAVIVTSKPQPWPVGELDLNDVVVLDRDSSRPAGRFGPGLCETLP